MKKNKIILLITLILLLISVSYAAEVSNDTINAGDAPTKTVQTSTDTQAVEQSVIKEEPNNKEIKKTTTNKTSKTASKTVIVTDFDTLRDALTSDTYSTLTLNLNSNIKLKGSTSLNDAIKTVTINGNGKTINGDNQYRFLFIYSDSKVTINNLKITNCNSAYGGAIENHYGILTIKNSTLSNNKGAIYGGAIYNIDYATMTLTGSSLYNNQADRGGAIYNKLSELNINNVTFTKNNASIEGGAICNSASTSTVTGSTFINNTADNGGAISNFGTLTLKNCNLNNNNAEENGGAIFNDEYSTITLIGNTLNNNNAEENGGAVYSIGRHDSIRENKFINNKALMGSAISFGYYIVDVKGNDTLIDKNTFITNKAEYEGEKELTGETIIDEGINTIIKGNINDNTSFYSYTIYIEGNNTRITNNIFDDNLINTKITITKITGKQYKDNITITGKFTNKDGTAIGNTELKLNLNGKNITAKTDDKGVYKYNTKANIIGKNNITVTFAGNKQYNASTAKTTFTVNKRTTKATITKIAQKTYKQNMTITGKLTDSTGTIIKNSNVKVKVNTKTYTVKTNSKGIYSLKVTANKVGTNNVTVKYYGNSYYKLITKKTTFKTVARATKLTVNKISTTTKGKKIKITGKLADNLKSPVMNNLVKIKINSKTVSVKTNKQGVYTYNYKTTTKGTNTVTVTFAGSTNYKKSSVKSSFSVK